MVSHAFSARVINVKNVQAEVAPVGVLLATASVDPYPSEGQCFQVRTLLDQRSTLSFISESLCQTPRTKRQRTDSEVRRVRSVERYDGRTFVAPSPQIVLIVIYLDKVDHSKQISRCVSLQRTSLQRYKILRFERCG